MNNRTFPKFLNFNAFALTFLTAFTLVNKVEAVSPASKKKPLKTTQIEPKEFDRLDGKGLSHKRVDVIEWENNLEIHVYPKGSLKSLGLKVDRKKDSKSVMVIEYAFNDIPYTIIRRAVLTLKITDSFKTFKAPTESEFDKIMISNNSLSSDSVIPFLAVHEPRALYPDYYGEPETNDSNDSKINTPPLAQSRSENPIEENPKTYEGIHPNAQNLPGIQFKQKERSPANMDEDGNIRSFEF